MRKLYDEYNGIISAEPIEYDFCEKQKRSILDILLNKPYKPTANYYHDRKIKDHFLYYNIVDKMELWNGFPIHKQVLVCMSCFEFEDVTVSWDDKFGGKIICNQCGNKYFERQRIKKELNL